MKELFKNLSHLMTHRKKVYTNGFVELMDRILSGIPNVGWELGHLPNDYGVDQLSLSVINNPLFIKQVEDSISFPIKGDDWVINLGIPPRDWELFFEINTEDGQIVEVEGSEWSWVMTDKNN
ncbi:MAG: hypothetical protein KGO49_13490 [Gammaproteobacteria bacterium]|nr:hypothetical protein [Gammaproteobacteria bacterium]